MRGNGGAKNAKLKATLAGVLAAAFLGIAAGLFAGTVGAAQFRSAELTVDGRDRQLFLHIPVPGREPMAVVFVLHGGGGEAKNIATYLNFGDFSNDANVLFVYPQGYEEHWNDGRRGLDYAAHREEVDDVEFFRQALDLLDGHFPLDRRRVYVTGISNGGMMALRAACEAADIFVAAAVLAANMPRDLASGCDPARPVSLLLVNGTADPLIPYEGGAVRFFRRELGTVLSTDETIGLWRRLDGCAGEPARARIADADPDDGSTVAVETYGPCRDGARVTLYRVDGGGHTWPGRSTYAPEWMVGTTNRDFDATRHVLDFLLSHQR